MKRLAPLALTILLAACGAGPGYMMELPAVQSRLSTPARTIMLREVSMPDYAADDYMARQGSGGAVEFIRRTRWADLQPRAATLALARQLDRTLDATVAPEPWPLSGLPDGEVDIRVSRILAGTNGTFRLDGIFYVRAEGVSLGAPSREFAIAVPMPDDSPAGIAAAQSAALAQLAAVIAASVAR
ncbi:PqiC family protein [Falsirhodobacter xinxiangensis]|uniref:PqiC family protein n=1 Tax=Falsirhodobacter xinxiangensis TaxID=2530049 RepID=UPI0010AA6297|nr:ABC-type transport auxiliary lipoprotein family protein [Rhodobacter xinxiangensis]